MEPLLLGRRDVLEVARLGRSVGLRGGIRFRPLTDFTGLFEPGSTLYLRADPSFASFVGRLAFSPTAPVGVEDSLVFYPVRVAMLRADTSVIFFDGVEDRVGSGLMRNEMLFCSKLDIQRKNPLSDGEFYHFDIVGCTLVEDGVEIGTVSDVIKVAGLYYFKVLKGSGSAGYLVPYIDRYVSGVDICRREVYTRDAKWLLE